MSNDYCNLELLTLKGCSQSSSAFLTHIRTRIINDKADVSGRRELLAVTSLSTLAKLKALFRDSILHRWLFSETDPLCEALLMLSLQCTNE